MSLQITIQEIKDNRERAIRPGVHILVTYIGEIERTDFVVPISLVSEALNRPFDKCQLSNLLTLLPTIRIRTILWLLRRLLHENTIALIFE
jgi:hypothetical protein